MSGNNSDITQGEVSWSDRLFNTVTGVFEVISQTELQKYMEDRLGLGEQKTEKTIVYQTPGQTNGTWNNPYEGGGMSQQTVLYVAAAAMLAIGVTYAVVKK